MLICFFFPSFQMREVEREIFSKLADARIHQKMFIDKIRKII